MSSTKLPEVENTNIDLNSLFNLTYNFDLLKQTLETMLRNQKIQSQRITALDDKIIEKDKKISEMEEKIGKMNVTFEEENSKWIVYLIFY